MELAYVVNDRAPASAEPSYTAALEHRRVDITLVPPATPVGARLPDNSVEMKLVSIHYWNPAWRQVGSDLRGRDRKPAAHFAICFVINDVAPRIYSQRREAAEKCRKLLDMIPSAPQPIEPARDCGPFHVFWSGPTHRINWQHAVYAKWPEGYSADVRIVWLHSVT